MAESQTGAPTMKRRIGDMLVEAGVITPAMLSEALEVQQQRGTKIVETLVQLGHLTVDEFVNFLSRQPGIASIDLAHYHISNDIVSVIPKELALKHEIFPIDRMGRLLTLAMACPLDAETIAEIQEQTGLRVKPILCHAEDIYTAIHTYYPDEVPDEDPEWRWEAIVRKELAAVTTTKARSGMRLQHTADLIKELSSLPALPVTVGRVQEAMGDLTISPREVAHIISDDPPVAAKVLSVANSAAYGFASQVETIELAVALLGLRETYAIVLSAAVLDLFDVGKRFDYKRFWEESMNAAAAARIIAKSTGNEKHDSVFAAGLLHDIGRIALLETVPDMYVKVSSDLVGDELLQAEQEFAGLSHTEAGYELAVHWNLPGTIALPIRYHHHPDRAESCTVQVGIVALAERWTRDLAILQKNKKAALKEAAPLFKQIGMDASMGAAAYDLVAALEPAHFAWDAGEPAASA